MNNDLRNVLDTIEPTNEQKARMLSVIQERTCTKERADSPVRRNTKWLRVAAVAAALCCVFSMSVFAEEITGFIAGIFTGDAIVGSEVKTCVYSDTDGHVKMTVEEVLSDLNTVRIVVHYKALDEQGKEWMSTLSFLGDDPEWYDENDQFGFELDPVSIHSVSGAFGASEIKQHHTDSERRFVVFMELCADDWGTEAKLSYDMPDGSREAFIDVSTNIDKRVYILDSAQAPERKYLPTYVKISPLTIGVFGENLGQFKYVEMETGDGWHYYIEPLTDELVASMRLVFDDGSEIVMFTGGSPCQNMSLFGVVPSTEDTNDCMIVTMSFDQPIDPDTVSGIEIDGIFYPFK